MRRKKEEYSTSAGTGRRKTRTPFPAC